MDLNTPTQPQLEPQSALTDRLDRLTLSGSPASVGAQPNALSGPAPGLHPGGEPAYSSSGSSSSSTGAGAGAGTGVEGLAPAFAVGGNGSGGPGFTTQYRGHQANEFLTPSSSSSASGGVYRSAIENGSGNGGNGRGSGTVSPVSSAGYGAGAGGSRMQGGQQQQSGVVVNGEGEEMYVPLVIS
ncbi:hypothetical protein JCM11641_001701 [Rhodosporidiobolus odoratus]